MIPFNLIPFSNPKRIHLTCLTTDISTFWYGNGKTDAGKKYAGKTCRARCTNRKMFAARERQQIPATYDAAGRQFFQARNLSACVMGLRGTQLSRREKRKYCSTYTAATARRSLSFPSYIGMSHGDIHVTCAYDEIMGTRYYRDDENAKFERELRELRISTRLGFAPAITIAFAFRIVARSPINRTMRNR